MQQITLAHCSPNCQAGFCCIVPESEPSQPVVTMRCDVYAAEITAGGHPPVSTRFGSCARPSRVFTTLTAVSSHFSHTRRSPPSCWIRVGSADTCAYTALASGSLHFDIADKVSDAWLSSTCSAQKAHHHFAGPNGEADVTIEKGRPGVSATSGCNGNQLHCHVAKQLKGARNLTECAISKIVKSTDFFILTSHLCLLFFFIVDGQSNVVKQL